MRGLVFIVFILLCSVLVFAETLPQDILPGFEEMQQAIDSKDPQILIDNTEEGKERDTVLAIYAWTALDTSVLDMIEDPRVHDGTLIGLITVAYGRFDVAPKKDYCDQLKGGYTYDADIGLPEEELIMNRVMCNQFVAATNQLVDNDNSCEEHIEATFESEYAMDDPFYAEDKKDSIQGCKDFVQQVTTLKEDIENAETPEELLELAREAELFGSCDYSGVYQTNWGEMTIRHSGSSITADYTHDKGRIDGSLEGSTLRGTWYEAPSYAGPTDAGPLEFYFSDDCSSFTGKWAYESTSSGWAGDWGGSTKIRSVPLPKTNLADEKDINLVDFEAPSTESVPANDDVMIKEDVEEEPEIADLEEEVAPVEDAVEESEEGFFRRIIDFLFGWLK